MKLNLTFLKWYMSLGVIKKSNLLTVGITNETQDYCFVPFMDFDDIYEEKLLMNIGHIQSVFRFGPMIVGTTSETDDGMDNVYGNYIVFGLDKIPHGMHEEMLYHTCCDKKYRVMWKALPQKNWVLRIAEKFKVNKDGTISIERPAVKLKTIVYPHSHGIYALSAAHLKFLTNLFDISNLILDGYKIDNGDKLQFKKIVYDEFNNKYNIQTIIGRPHDSEIKIIPYQAWSD